jgi:hypothetical protein
MIRKSGYRFSEKIMLKQEDSSAVSSIGGIKPGVRLFVLTRFDFRLEPAAGLQRPIHTGLHTGLRRAVFETALSDPRVTGVRPFHPAPVSLGPSGRSPGRAFSLHHRNVQCHRPFITVAITGR